MVMHRARQFGVRVQLGGSTEQPEAVIQRTTVGARASGSGRYLRWAKVGLLTACQQSTAQ